MAFKIRKESGLLDGVVKCDEHDCPMIAVEQDGKDDYLCLFEAVDRLIGQQRITRVEVSGGFIRSLQFENGYQISPLCPCCGEPTLQDRGSLNNQMLTGMAWETVDDSEHYSALVLFFAETPEATETETVPIHIESVRSLQRIGS